MEKSIIYNTDLKHMDLDNYDLTNSIFENEETKQNYFNSKLINPIELRIQNAKKESYEFLDLSNLSIDDAKLNEIFQLKKIQKILCKIPFIDLSFNALKTFPDLSLYPHILSMDIRNNLIIGSIQTNQLVELVCDYNKIISIESNSLIRLSASNNQIQTIDLTQIEILTINHNQLTYLQSIPTLTYLESIDNKIQIIKSMNLLKELYLNDNQIEKIYPMNQLLILNCINNPIKRIGYFPLLTSLMCSTDLISNKYNIQSISKTKQDFVLIFNKD